MASAAPCPAWGDTGFNGLTSSRRRPPPSMLQWIIALARHTPDDGVDMSAHIAGRLARERAIRRNNDRRIATSLLWPPQESSRSVTQHAIVKTSHTATGGHLHISALVPHLETSRQPERDTKPPRGLARPPRAIDPPAHWHREQSPDALPRESVDIAAPDGRISIPICLFIGDRGRPVAICCTTAGVRAALQGDRGVQGLHRFGCLDRTEVSVIANE